MDEVTPVCLRDLQRAETALLRELILFFEANAIRYYALGGTLLGAVRHGGFIPWDDDIDIGVPRSDYERLIHYPNASNLPFELHTHYNDSSHQRYFIRVEDPSIRVMRTDVFPAELTAAWIDVFPLDGMPERAMLRKVHWHRILVRRALFRLASPSVQLVSKKRPWYERFLLFLRHRFATEMFLDFDRQWRKLDRLLKRYDFDGCSTIVNAMGYWKEREIFPKEWYGEGVSYQFEDLTINGPVDYDDVLTRQYGDWRTPSRENKHRTAVSESSTSLG